MKYDDDVKATDVLDSVYFLVQNGKNILYTPPTTNVRQCWINAARWDMFEGGGEIGDVDEDHVKGFIKSMKSVGWRATKLNIGSRN